MAYLLADLAGRQPGDLALADGRIARSWSELDDRVNRWISALRHAGLTPGDRVALLLGNRVETIEVLLACLHAGLLAVPVHSRLTAPEVRYVLDDARCAGVVTEPEHARTAVDAGALGRRFAVTTGARPVAGLPAAEMLLAPAGTEPGEQHSGGVLLYTSGTEGAPKGVRQGLFRPGEPMKRLRSRMDGLGRLYGIDGVPALLAGPWQHSAQLFFALTPLLRGGRLMMREGFDPGQLLEDLTGGRIASCHLVPTQLIRLLRLDPERRAAFDPVHLRRVWHGGGPCPASVKKQMLQWWGPVLVEYYGATEAGLITMIEADEWSRRPGSVGRPVPPTEIVVVGPGGRPVPTGSDGLVYVRRPFPSGLEYLGAPEKTRAAHRSPGEFTVGDVGHLDEDGYLHLTGRSADVIVSGSVNIYPAEVEAALLAHPSVADAAVLGVPDPEFHERVMALVRWAGPDPEEAPAVLDRHCRSRLAGYKVPRRYALVDELPRNAAGKLDRRALRAAHLPPGAA